MNAIWLTGSRVADLAQASPAFRAARDIMRPGAPLRFQEPPTVDVPAGPYAPTYAPREPYRGLRFTDVPTPPAPRPAPPPPAKSLEELEYYGMPHVGPRPGGYLAPGLTREEAIELEERMMERDILELRRRVWGMTVEGPTAGFPAGGGMAFPGT